MATHKIDKACMMAAMLECLPCITCVQYRGAGRVQYGGGYHDACGVGGGGYLEYYGECSVPLGISYKCEGYHEYYAGGGGLL